MQIQFTERQVRALRRAAAHRGVSQSEIVRLSLDSYLGAPSSVDRAELRSRVRDLIGAFSGTAGDVSTRHDEYLADAIADWDHGDS